MRGIFREIIRQNYHDRSERLRNIIREIMRNIIREIMRPNYRDRNHEKYY